jgi:predicted acetyltransferase
MERLKLVLPKAEYEAACLAYRKEFEQGKEIMHGTSGLAHAESFDAWLRDVEDGRYEDNLIDYHVPATTYLAVTIDTHHLVGMVNIRHRLNDYLKTIGGHIGYSVRKSERQQGYATEMLGLALKQCKTLGIPRVLITCDQDNFASAKTIKNNHGQLERTFMHEGTMIEHYWIELNK